MNIYPLIDGKLYQTGVVGEVEAIRTLSPECVIDCTYGFDTAEVFSPEMFVRVPFSDKPLDPDGAHKTLMNRLHAVAALASLFILSGGKVLTHCMAGFNRSSLVDGMILLLLKEEKAVAFDSVVKFIQEKRPGALFNESFRAYLEKLEREG